MKTTSDDRKKDLSLRQKYSRAAQRDARRNVSRPLRRIRRSSTAIFILDNSILIDAINN
jgi:hypothetical protein